MGAFNSSRTASNPDAANLTAPAVRSHALLGAPFALLGIEFFPSVSGFCLPCCPSQVSRCLCSRHLALHTIVREHKFA